MRRSTSKSSTTAPELEPLLVPPGPARAAISVDVEEWYHNCWMPEYVDPARRPPLVDELDRLLPWTAGLLAEAGAKATFFVLGEVARRIPGRIRELAAAGHEVACHGELHLRANDRSPAAFRQDIAGAKALLEDLVGAEVAGFRAPEWSLREAANPRFRIVAEAGFAYDSSLLPALGAGARANPTRVSRYRWPDGLSIVEAPATTGGGPLRLPVGGWCGRLAPPERLVAAAGRAAAEGGLPLFVVHPWELVDRPCPGILTGLARFFHDAGRAGFGDRFRRLLTALACDAPLVDCLRAAESLATAAPGAARGSTLAAVGAPP